MEPAAIPIAIIVTLVCVCAGALTVIGRVHRARREVGDKLMPVGADEALWSVIEVLPDPRNHLAIKDPTSEMRLTDQERADAATAARPPVVAARPAQRAADEQSLAARQDALAKHEALTREKARVALGATR